MRVVHLSDLHTGIYKINEDKIIRGYEYDQDIQINKEILANPNLELKKRKKLLKDQIIIFKRKIENLHQTKKIDLAIVPLIY